MRTRVRSGLEQVLTESKGVLAGKRVALLCNPTSVDRELRHAADLFRALPGVELATLFGPEHGVRGDAQDMIATKGGRDPQTGVPVFSLYGAKAESLEIGRAHV